MSAGQGGVETAGIKTDDPKHLTDLDLAALAAYCQAYGRCVDAERKLSETPMLLKMPSGYVQQNPWLTIANKQFELMQHHAGSLVYMFPSKPHLGPKPWHFGQSKFDGLLGEQKDDFIDD